MFGKTHKTSLSYFQAKYTFTHVCVWATIVVTKMCDHTGDQSAFKLRSSL